MGIVKNTSIVAAIVVAFILGWSLSGRSLEGAGDKEPKVKGWTKGKGWSPISKEDEIGALNAMTPESIKAALDQNADRLRHNCGPRQTAGLRTTGMDNP